MIRFFSFSDKKKFRRKKENDSKHLWSTTGIGVVLEKDAKLGGEVLKQMDQFKLKKEPRLNWGPNLSLEWQLEKVFKMKIGNMKKFLLLNIVTADKKSNSDPTPQAWYCIDLSKMRCEGDNWVVGKMDLKVRKMPQNSPYPGMCVALSSVIYIIGDYYGEQSITCTFHLDTSNPKNEWLEGPSMNLCRKIGSAVVHDGKIYVFGGFVEYLEDKPCFGEEYDPKLYSWEPLSDPPEVLDGLQGNFVGSYHRKILVHPCRNQTLYAYDVVDKSWEVLDRHFGFWHCRGVIMDDVLYVFNYARVEICGYDLVRLKWLKPINLDHLEWFSRTKNSEGMVLHEAFFFKVEANVLCFVYFDWMGEEGLDIYCKMFTIKKIVQENGDVVLEAEVFSSTIYNLGEMGRCLNYVVM